MNKTLKWILLLAGALLLVFLVVKMIGKGRRGGLKVTAETVRRRTITETVSASGKLYPEVEIKVGSPINGEVTALTVAEGDSVKQGQVLARIQGERGASSAQRISIPNVPPGFEGLVQSIQPPRTSSAPTAATLTAPISGTVIALNAKKGERVGAMQMPGSELLRLADMSKMEVRVDVNENNIIKISTGDSADVEVEAYNKRKFKGVVTSIASGGSKRDAQSFLSNDVTSYEVHIRLLPSSYADLFDSSRPKSLPFRPGMNARADIKTRRKDNVLSIPVGAVISKPKGSGENPGEAKNNNGNEDDPATDDSEGAGELEEVVYVVKSDGSVERRVVTTGIQDINHIEIVSGLNEGERVVTGPYNAVSKTLRNGTKIQVVPKDQLFQNE